MSRVFICGLGAVSPAGWTVAGLTEALDRGVPLPIQPLQRPGWQKPLRARCVPNPVTRPAFLAFVMSSNPNHPAAANPATTSRCHSGGQRRRFADRDR